MNFIKWLVKLFDANERELRKLRPILNRVNQLEAEVSKLSDDTLRAKTGQFKERIARGESLDSILPEAFAVVREAAKRTVNMRHFDVQILGGIVLHQGRIAEMKTGEGKTLVATLPAYLNALSGKGVHIVTVNDYLAKRDRFWMGPIYEFLGLSVGYIQHHMDQSERRKMYACDITYVTNNELGFDYLRDNMVYDLEDRVLRGLHYAIVDEVDSILIDEARTPLIISGVAEEDTSLYYKFARIAASLERDKHYTVDEKAHAVPLTEEGIKRVQQLLKIDNLYSDENWIYAYHIGVALKAKELFRRDEHYVVKDGEVIIVDEFTGRLMYGRRYSDGIHQAIEAKEGLRVRQEAKTLATITFQNLFRLYEKLAGMTGTAATEEEEFKKIYGLDVVVIPTHKPMIRIDHPDLVFRTERGKFRYVADFVAELHRKGRPVLIGTRSIEKSEYLSRLLKERKVPHQVLNAKYHEKEAQIIAQAGRYGAVTVATNMAGRGVDIVLGGNPPDPEEQRKVIELGGLYVIGTERHEARRIDNQLRGRSGRQGDPGETRFFVSMEDEILRIFGGDKLWEFIERIFPGLDLDKEPQSSPILTKQIESIQKKVENHNFQIRKQLLAYDDVMNMQRKRIYEDRDRILKKENLPQIFLGILESVVERLADNYFIMMEDTPERRQIIGELEEEFEEEFEEELEEEIEEEEEVSEPQELSHEEKLDRYLNLIREYFPASSGFDYEFIKAQLLNADELDRNSLKNLLFQWAKSVFDQRRAVIPEPVFDEVLKFIMLRVIDTKWVDHLQNMEALKRGVALRAWGQIDPIIAYRKEGSELFEEMLKSVEDDIVKLFYRLRVKLEVGPPLEDIKGLAPGYKNVQLGRGEGMGGKPQGRKPKEYHKIKRRYAKIKRR